jgi:hypothetical protein
LKIAASISVLREWYCALRSTKGIFTFFTSANFSCGVAGVYAGFQNIFSNHRSGTDYNVIGNSDGHDGCVCAYGDIISDGGGLPEGPVAAGWTSLAEGIVNEHGTVRDEAIAADSNELAYKGVRLDSGIVADNDAFLDFDEGANKNVIADFAFIDVNGFNDLYVMAELNVSNSAF